MGRIKSQDIVTHTPQNINCRRMNLELGHPQRSVVASLGNGRLGNQMSNFASCYALFKDYNMYHYLNSMQLGLLEKEFILPELEDTDDASYYFWDEECIKGKSLPWKGISDQQLARSRNELEKYKNGTYVKLGPYTTD